MAGVATSYDTGDFDSIFLSKDRPAYNSTNSHYGASLPQFFAYENTYNDVQRLRETLMLQQAKLSRKNSESGLSVAEEMFAPEFAVGSNDPRGAPKYNRSIREQAAAKRIEDLRRLRSEELESQLRSVQRQQEYREFLDMQQKLKEGTLNTAVSAPEYSTQLRHTRKTKKTMTYDPLVGEVKDYSDYLFQEDFKPKYGHFTPQPVPGSYIPLSQPLVVTKELGVAINAFYGVDEPRPEQTKVEAPRKKLAGYGQLVVNGPPPDMQFTRKSGLAYRPTSFLIR
jgi:hypothetical protein